MKVISKDYRKGFFKLLVDCNDDLWSLYKLINEGDVVSGRTLRKIVKGEKSEGERKPVFIKIKVKKVDFQESQFILRALGTVLEGPDDVPRGVHHSFLIKPGVKLTLEKEEWSTYDKQLIKKSCEPARGDLLIVTIDNEEAYYSLLSKDKTAGINTQKSNLPRKDSPDYEKTLQDYYKKVVKNTKNLVKAKNAKKAIIACVGFICEELKELFKSESEISGKLYFTKVSVTGVTGVNELIKKGVIDKIRSEDLITRETKLVDEFLAALGKQKLVAYGFKEVKEAINAGAGKLLLISEQTIIDFRMRNKFKALEGLLNNAEQFKTRIEFVSVNHEAGERLYRLGGIGLLLRYEV